MKFLEPAQKDYWAELKKRKLEDTEDGKEFIQEVMAIQKGKINTKYFMQLKHKFEEKSTEGDDGK